MGNEIEALFFIEIEISSDAIMYKLETLHFKCSKKLTNIEQ